ncbi:Peroxisomal multifunctional enzyme type 2, partial [Globisporangium splendens]
MREQNFGRIVNISSASGLYGNFGQANYSAAKMGIAGLTFTLSKEGAKRNVLSNVVAPLAASQMTDGIVEEELFKLLKPEHVAPFVAYLCHESCTRNGNVYEVGAGWVAKVRWERSRGLVFPPNGMELDDIAAQMDEIEFSTFTFAPVILSSLLQNFNVEPKSYPNSLQDSLDHIRSLFKLG